MERLTTEKPTKEMGMYELAMNCCYVKDSLVRYRDFETDVDARDLARKLLKKYVVCEDGDDLFVDDDVFDEEMLEMLIYGTDTIDGLIAVFYRNLWAMAELREQLKEYEQAEEDGLLPRFHLGDEFWCLYIDEVVKAKIVTLQQKKDGSWNYTLSREISENYHDIAYYKEREYGKYFWTTKAEAEQALAKMKGEEE